jgi:hypothetical protein
MAAHPVRFTITAPCSGLVSTDEDIPLQLLTTGTNAGTFAKTLAGVRVSGRLVAVEKVDTGGTPKLCTVEYQGILRFTILDATTLANADLNKGIKGAADGEIALVAYDSTYDEDVVGRVIDFSNTTDNKWVDVLMPAQ